MLQKFCFRCVMTVPDLLYFYHIIKRMAIACVLNFIMNVTHLTNLSKDAGLLRYILMKSMPHLACMLRRHQTWTQCTCFCLCFMSLNVGALNSVRSRFVVWLCVQQVSDVLTSACEYVLQGGSNINGDTFTTRLLEWHVITNVLRNDLYCVEWGVKLYSLTHSCQHVGISIVLPKWKWTDFCKKARAWIVYECNKI